MAITNFKRVDQPRNPVNRNLVSGGFYAGTGEPALTDALVKNPDVYPVGTQYLDTEAPGTLYIRIATAGALADFSSVALTAPA